jgi:hypothetical protein
MTNSKQGSMAGVFYLDDLYADSDSSATPTVSTKTRSPRSRSSSTFSRSISITGRREPELAAAVKEIGRDVAAVRGAVSNLDDLDRLFAQIKREKGKLDVQNSCPLSSFG